MLMHKPSGVVALAVVITQLLGPGFVWAVENDRGVRLEAAQHLTVTGTRGGDVLARRAESSDPARVLHFRDRVGSGDLLSIGSDTSAEILIGTQALVTAHGPAQFRIASDNAGHPLISLMQGDLLVAIASSPPDIDRAVEIETPHAHLSTPGGLILVTTETGQRADAPSVSRHPQVLLASYTAPPLMAANGSSTELIQILEGSGTLRPSDVGATPVALEAGQGVQVTNGALGTPFVPAASPTATQPVMAVSQHARTPTVGAQYLAETQMAQAAALQQVLLGASESTSDEVQGQNASKNAVISTLNATLGGSSSSSSNSLALLFGAGNPFNSPGQNPQDRGGTGYGGNNNQGFNTTESETKVSISGANGLLVFTRKDPVEAVGIDPTSSCPNSCTGSDLLNPMKVVLRAQPSIPSNFTAIKELLLIGGTPNQGHGGIAPTETLIVRGAAPAPGSSFFTNVSATPTVFPPNGLFIQADFGPRAADGNSLETVFPLQKGLTAQNSTFVVQTPSKELASNDPSIGTTIVQGTLAQYSNQPDSIAFRSGFSGMGSVDTSFVDGAITATGPTVTLKGGVTLDHGTAVTIGTTQATNNYFTSNGSLNPVDAKFNGSLISVISGPGGPVSLTINDRALAVFDGSSITGGSGNKALLSVLDSRLTGPGSVPLIDIDAAGGAQPTVPNVTSAVVVRSTLPVGSLDQALLVASAPLLALTNATMTTTSHFADFAGNKNHALNLQASALVGLNAATLAIQNGHLLNLNAASATINGYLFSLANGSTLSLNNGLLFNLTNGSNLNLNANAFGVFGNGTNTFTVANGLCGGGAACGQLVNSANAPFNGPNGPIRVAGTNQNLVLPNNFNVFAAQNPASPQNINIGATDALFKVDATSTLTINGTLVKK